MNYLLSPCPYILFISLISLLQRNQHNFEQDHFLPILSWLKTVDTNGWMASMYVQTHWSTSTSHQLVEYPRWRLFEEESNVWRSLLSRERSCFPTTSPHGSLEISLSSQSFQWWLWPMRVSTITIIPWRKGSYACSIPETLMEPGLWVGMQRIFYSFNRWHRDSL